MPKDKELPDNIKAALESDDFNKLAEYVTENCHNLIGIVMRQSMSGILKGVKEYVQNNPKEIALQSQIDRLRGEIKGRDEHIKKLQGGDVFYMGIHSQQDITEDDLRAFQNKFRSSKEPFCGELAFLKVMDQRDAQRLEINRLTMELDEAREMLIEIRNGCQPGKRLPWEKKTDVV